MRKQHTPRVADPLMKADVTLSALRLKIGSLGADANVHVELPGFGRLSETTEPDKQKCHPQSGSNRRKRAVEYEHGCLPALPQLRRAW
jgi:hypothetical protein